MRRVVITGLGAVSPLGNDLSTSVDHVLAGASGVRRCDRLLYGRYGERIRARVGGTVEGFDPRNHVPERYVDSYDPATCYALAAAAEALDASGLEVEPERAGVLIGSAAPGNRTWHEAFLQSFVGEGADSLPGHMLLQLSGNIYSGAIAHKHGLRGPNFGVSDACATGATALCVAADLIRAGRADAMLAGGTDAPIGLVTYGSMLSAGAMRATDDPVGAACPFSAQRAGLVMGEGAGVVVLERRDHALARGAHIYGELLGESMTNDAWHLYSPAPEGASWARTIRVALDRAGLGAEAVEAVSAHAASTPIGDLNETLALKQVFGERAYEVPVFATKSQIGHTLGACGALETVLALGAFEAGRLPPTINLERRDPQCDLDYVANTSRPGTPRVLLKNSFGFAGTNTCLLIARE